MRVTHVIFSIQNTEMENSSQIFNLVPVSHDTKRSKPSLPLPCSAAPVSPLPPPPMDVSAVHAALAEKSYSTVAPLCDDLFLQVSAGPIHRRHVPPDRSPLSHGTRFRFPGRGPRRLHHRRLAIRRPPPRPPLPERPVRDPPHLVFPAFFLCFWELGFVVDSVGSGSTVSRNSARFLWKSLLQQVKDARPELAAVWRIGQCLWNRDYAGVYAAVQGFEWGPELAEFLMLSIGNWQIGKCI
jgi:hypothetical protein